MFDLKIIRVLLLDDSSVAILSIKDMLIRIGFSKDFVSFSQDPKVGVSLASKDKFDLIICDYNFNSTLDGRQVLEELEFSKCLEPSSVFIMITGDSSLKTVNSMLELEVDDYIVKPFNQMLLRDKLYQALRRKNSLKDIYMCKQEGNFYQGLKTCDELLLFNSEYTDDIQKEKGFFLQKLNLWDVGESYYTNLLMSKSDEWIFLGLANCLRNLGEYEKAKLILGDATYVRSNSISAMKQLVLIDNSKLNIKSSITRLKIIENITNPNPDILLSISNLYLAQDDFCNSYVYYKKYISSCKGTFRNVSLLKVNLLRRALFCFENNTNIIEFKIAYMIKNIMILSHDIANVNFTFKTLLAHYFLLKHQFSEMLIIMNQCYRHVNSNQHLSFYDLHHFCYLLNKCSFDSEFSSVMAKLTYSLESPLDNFIHRNSNEMVLSSLSVMKDKMSLLHKEKHMWLYDCYCDLKDKNDLDKLAIYIKISNFYPTLISVRLKVIKLLNRVCPEGYSKSQVYDLLSTSDDVVRVFSSDDDLRNSNYEIYFNGANSFILNYPFNKYYKKN